MGPIQKTNLCKHYSFYLLLFKKKKTMAPSQTSPEVSLWFPGRVSCFSPLQQQKHGRKFCLLLCTVFGVSTSNLKLSYNKNYQQMRLLYHVFISFFSSFSLHVSGLHGPIIRGISSCCFYATIWFMQCFVDCLLTHADDQQSTA